MRVADQWLVDAGWHIITLPTNGQTLYRLPGVTSGLVPYDIAINWQRQIEDKKETQ